MIPLQALLSSTRDAHAPVCRDGAHVLDVAAFRARVFAIARALRARPEPHAVRYALCIDDPFDFACTLFAMFACNKEPVIPANSTPGYLADLADAYEVLLTDAYVIDMVGTIEAGSHQASAARCETDAGASPGRPCRIDPNVSLTMFTSGSSGTPKPVRKTLAQLNAEAHTLEAEWGALLGEATILCSVPHHHMYGLSFRLMWPLAAGRAFERTLCTEPSQIQACLAQYGAAIVISTPAMLSRWPAMAGFSDLSPKPRAFFSAGSALSATTTAEYVQAFGSSPIDIFGSTEAGVIAWRRIDVADAWQPMIGIDVRLGRDNVLDIRSPHLGYGETDTEATEIDTGADTEADAEIGCPTTGPTTAQPRNNTQGNWYSTDDIVAFDAAGRFRLIGRRDRVIKLAGKRVSLTEIEARLASHAYVRTAAAVVLDRTPRHCIGVALVLTDAGSDALYVEGRVRLARTLRRHLADYFDPVMLPRYWRFCLALPVDARGKLPAAALNAMFVASSQGPEILAEMRHDNAMLYDLRIPPALEHFAGHFPGTPILPGVVQVDWAVRLAARQRPDLGAIASVDRLKFTAPVRPGAMLRLTLKHDAVRRRTSFLYRSGERDCASGILVYRTR